MPDAISTEQKTWGVFPGENAQGRKNKLDECDALARWIFQQVSLQRSLLCLTSTDGEHRM
jgi:hypothetical protein